MCPSKSGTHLDEAALLETHELRAMLGTTKMTDDDKRPVGDIQTDS